MRFSMRSLHVDRPALSDRALILLTCMPALARALKPFTLGLQYFFAAAIKYANVIPTACFSLAHACRHMKESFNAMVQLQQRMATLQLKQHQLLHTNTSNTPADASPGNGDGRAQQAAEDGADGDEAAKLHEQYSYLASVLHSAVGLASTVATHNPSLAQAAKLEAPPLLNMLKGALTTLKVRKGERGGGGGLHGQSACSVAGECLYSL